MSMDGKGLSPLRQWVQNQLNQIIPNNGGTIRSDTNGALFEKWTGWTQVGLGTQWALEAGTGAVTTSCNAFLGKVVYRIREAGGLSTDAPFQSFNLPKAGGTAWHWAGEAGAQPQPGDLFQIGTPGPDLSNAAKGGTFKHVGIILDIDYIIWITVEGGQGGPKSGFDAIKRKVQVRPSGLMGWINIDEFFVGWKGASGASA